MPAHTEQEARERLRLHHYHLWKALVEGEEAGVLLMRWRNAPGVAGSGGRRSSTNRPSVCWRSP
jgi:hypothetical protein